MLVAFGCGRGVYFGVGLGLSDGLVTVCSPGSDGCVAVVSRQQDKYLDNRNAVRASQLRNPGGAELFESGNDA